MRNLLGAGALNVPNRLLPGVLFRSGAFNTCTGCIQMPPVKASSGACIYFVHADQPTNRPRRTHTCISNAINLQHYNQGDIESELTRWYPRSFGAENVDLYQVELGAAIALLREVALLIF
jgi:hypothetical protein